MGIFSRIKRSAKAKANAAIDGARDPRKEIDLAIAELEDQHKSALKQLVRYKAEAKLMKAESTRLGERAERAEKAAMSAVSKGDDELARECLAAKQQASVERDKIERDWEESTGYAIELNRARKTLESRLKMIKLKRGTMATQIAAARSGTGNPLGTDESLFDRFNEAERQIDDEAILAEVHAAAEGFHEERAPTPALSAGSQGQKSAVADSEGARRLNPPTRDGGGQEDDSLSTIRAQLEADGDVGADPAAEPIPGDDDEASADRALEELKAKLRAEDHKPSGGSGSSP